MILLLAIAVTQPKPLCLPPDRAIAAPCEAAAADESDLLVRIEIEPAPGDAATSDPEPVELVDLCGLQPPPGPSEFGPHGVQAHYSFVTHGAEKRDLGAFLADLSDAGFSFLPFTLNLNGFDTALMPGRRALRNRDQLVGEFKAACSLNTGSKIFLAHVRYNPTTEQQSEFRVR